MADPFDVLRLDVELLHPDPGFAARLRRQLEDALGAGAAAALAGDQHEVVPYLCVHDGAAALRFYAAAFAAQESMRFVGDDGRVGHAEFSIGGNRFNLADEFPEIGVLSPRTLGGSAVSLVLTVRDVDAVYRRAVAAGADGQRPPEDQSHGNRTAGVVDPFGHRWMLRQPLESLTLQEQRERHAGSWRVSGGDDEGGGDEGGGDEVDGDG